MTLVIKYIIYVLIGVHRPGLKEVMPILILYDATIHGNEGIANIQAPDFQKV